MLASPGTPGFRLRTPIPLRLIHARKTAQARDFACGLPLGYASLTPAKRLNIQLSKIISGNA